MVGKKSVGLNWDREPDVAEYLVEYALSNSVSWTTDDRTTGTSYTVTGLQCGTAYQFRVRSRGDGTQYTTSFQNTRPSSPVTTTTGTCTVPGQVSTPTVSPGNGSLSVSWSAPSDGGSAITRYEVQHKRTTVTWPTGAGADNGTSLTRTITGLTNGLPYHVRVRACNTVGCGSWSTASTGTPAADPPIRTLPAVTISADSTEVTEGASIGFTVSSNPAPASNLAVKVSVTQSGSFITGTPPSSVTISAGSTQATFDVSTIDDSADEADGTVTGSIGSGSGYSVGSPSTASVAVKDNDCENDDIGNIGVNGDINWTDFYPARECSAPSHDPNGGVAFAHYFTFRLTQTAHVTIDLTSPTADTKLRLFNSGNIGLDSGSSNDDNDENPPGSSNTNSRVSRKLEGGEYFIQASLKGMPQGISHPFDISIEAIAWIPAWGHQPDHTVQYSIGPMPPTPTPSPEPVDQSANGYEPGYIMPEAIATAVAAWNDAVSGSWPDVLFCERKPVKELHIGSAKPCPLDRTPDDDKTITISFTRDDCGFGGRVACIDPFTGHPGNLALDVVHPFQYFDDDKLVLVHGRYTLDPDKHRDRMDEDESDMNAIEFIYLPSAVMHELGHAAGLEDLYLDKYMADWDRYRGSIMWSAEDAHTSIPDFDKNYIKQVYRNEHGAKPHR